MSLKKLSALYWNDDEVWYGTVEVEPEMLEFTEADIEFEGRHAAWRRALQESMDRRH